MFFPNLILGGLWEVYVNSHKLLLLTLLVAAEKCEI